MNRIANKYRDEHRENEDEEEDADEVVRKWMGGSSGENSLNPEFDMGGMARRSFCGARRGRCRACRRRSSTRSSWDTLALALAQ